MRHAFCVSNQGLPSATLLTTATWGLEGRMGAGYIAPQLAAELALRQGLIAEAGLGSEHRPRIASPRRIAVVSRWCQSHRHEGHLNTRSKAVTEGQTHQAPDGGNKIFRATAGQLRRGWLTLIIWAPMATARTQAREIRKLSSLRGPISTGAKPPLPSTTILSLHIPFRGSPANGRRLRAGNTTALSGLLSSIHRRRNKLRRHR